MAETVWQGGARTGRRRDITTLFIRNLQIDYLILGNPYPFTNLIYFGHGLLTPHSKVSPVVRKKESFPMSYQMLAQPTGYGAPLAPIAPAAPRAPLAPMAPAAPRAPMAPNSYMRSSSIGVPTPPAAPLAPIAPAAPAAPGAPNSLFGVTLPTMPTIAGLPTTLSLGSPTSYGATTLGSSAPIRIGIGAAVAGLVSKIVGGAARHAGWGRGAGGGAVGGGVGAGGSAASQAIRNGSRAARSYSSRAASGARYASRSRSMAGTAGSGGGFLKAFGISALITIPLVAISDYMDYSAGKTTSSQMQTLILADSAGYMAAGGIGAWAGGLAAASMGGMGILVGLGVGAVASYAYEKFLRPQFPGVAT